MIKFLSHTIKLQEKIVEGRLVRKVTISEQNNGFMPGKSIIDLMFALRLLTEK